MELQEANSISQFVVGSVAIAASRDAMMRAEVLKVGDAVRVFVKEKYSTTSAVHTGVVVGFEPFKERPTIIIAYVKVDYASAKMEMLYFTGQEEGIEVLAAAPDTNIEIERSRVLDFFDQEETKALAKVAEVRAQRCYFEKYFGSVMPKAIEAPGQ